MNRGQKDGLRWTLTKEFTFEASHRLPRHDGKCARLHGHSWKMKVEVESPALCESGPKTGMVMDFGDIKAAVGYIPSNRVVGLSKMPRLVECFARRLQIQERLTQQVSEAMESVLKPKGVGVLIRARHLCMACRGVKQQEADMVTSALHGEFRRQEVRAEFFNLIAG